MRERITVASAFVVVALACALARAAPVDAVTRPSLDLELGATVGGTVAEVRVAVGDEVDAGAVLVRLDDAEVAARERLARLRSESTLRSEASEAQWKLAQNEQRRVEEAYERGGVAEFEVARARLETLLARVRYELARQEEQEAALTLSRERAIRAQFVITAPAAGVVERVDVEPGEPVEPLRPVVRVVSIDPLRVDAAVPIEEAAGIAPGAAARAEIVEGGGVLRGEVVSVASVADAASGTRTVRIDFANPERAPAGTRARVLFPDDDGR